MLHSVAPIPCKPWQLNGLSEALIVSHYEDTYGAAVRELNQLRAELAALDLATAPQYRIRALKRDEVRAWASVHLHELYFETLGGDGAVLFTGSGPGTPMTKPVVDALTRDFGSPAAWRSEFAAFAAALSAGSGWVVLAYSRRDGRLTNMLVDDHAPVVFDAAPLVVLDIYEHAYQRDFGSNVPAYCAAFLRNVDWSRVSERLQLARGNSAVTNTSNDALPSVSVEELSSGLAHNGVQIIDARPRHYYSRGHDMMSGATWRDPESIAEWSRELNTDAPVVVYCAYGFSVGCSVASELRERGFDAKYLRGGLAAWYAAGGERMLKHDA